MFWFFNLVIVVVIFWIGVLKFLGRVGSGVLVVCVGLIGDVGLCGFGIVVVIVFFFRKVMNFFVIF